MENKKAAEKEKIRSNDYYNELKIVNNLYTFSDFIFNVMI